MKKSDCRWFTMERKIEKLGQTEEPGVATKPAGVIPCQDSVARLLLRLYTKNGFRLYSKYWASWAAEKVMKLKLFMGVVVAANLCGCLSVNSYVDPNFKGANYSEIRAPAKKYAMNVMVEFQRNGEHLSEADGELRSHVERTLRATGITQPEFGGSDVTLQVVANNVGNRTAAAAKGIGTGLTLGAAGSTVTDAYEISIWMKVGGKEVKESYHHALHSTVGNADAPFPNVKATTPADAFGKVVEQVILKFVKDMQAKNLLVLIRPESIALLGHRNKRLISTVSAVVQGPGNNVFACARFPLQ